MTFDYKMLRNVFSELPDTSGYWDQRANPLHPRLARIFLGLYLPKRLRIKRGKKR